MKIKSLLFFALFMFTCTGIWAAGVTLRSDGYKWEEKRQRIKISKEDEKLQAIVLKHLVSHEYAYENEKKNNLFIYTIEHKIIRVNTDDAIEQNNKIYIPVSDVAEIIDIKARSISPSGKEMVLDKSNIKEVKDKDGSRAYKIFAIEGAEKGSEIEYISVRRRYPRLYGREFFQTSVPARNVEFELITPVNLDFSSKGYNGFPALKDTADEEKRYKTVKVAKVPALESEPFSFYTPNRMRVEYKLAYNTVQGSRKLMTYADAAKNIHANIYTLTKAETKAADKYFKSLKIKPGASTEDKVILIENHLKGTIHVRPGSGMDGRDISLILSNKWADEHGIARLFVAMLKRAGVAHELVITSDRTSIPFDRDFESFGYLDEFAIYINETDKFIAPDNITCRYGMIPGEWTNNEGLFVKEVQIGSVSSSIGEVRFIPALTHEQSFDNLDIHVALEKDMETAAIHIKRLMGGYSSAPIQPIYSMIPEDRRKNVMESIIKNSISDAVFKDLRVEGVEPNASPLGKPMVIDAKVTSASLIERAGNRYLFKFGELLGPQSEMYQTRERKLNIENHHNRSYNRVIRFQLPENYTIRNLKDIKMDVAYRTGEKEVCAFKSDYKLEGNTLTVTIEEYYSEITTRKEDYEIFRKVINAAADFNKVTLVLEKK